MFSVLGIVAVVALVVVALLVVYLVRTSGAAVIGMAPPQFSEAPRARRSIFHPLPKPNVFFEHRKPTRRPVIHTDNKTNNMSH